MAIPNGTSDPKTKLNAKNCVVEDKSCIGLVTGQVGKWVDVSGCPMVHVYMKANAGAPTANLQGTTDPVAGVMSNAIAAVTANLASDIYTTYPFVRIISTDSDAATKTIDRVWYYGAPYGA